jgi:hypothetical protein
MSHTKRRRWFSWSLRGLLALVTLIAVAAGFLKRADSLQRLADLHDHRGLDFAQRSMELRAGETIDPEHALALAKYHRNLADAYRYAAYRPWIIVSEPPLP